MARFGDLITQMTQAAVRGDGAGVAACFTPDGTYDDVFYGAFTGPEAIADMIDNHFHRDGENFRWDILDPLDDGGIGYARYVFSYDSRIAGKEGKRSVFEGIICCRLEGGLIARYSEVATAATGLHLMGFSADKIAKFVARQADELVARDEVLPHIS
jgi:hypothetical protein